MTRKIPRTPRSETPEREALKEALEAAKAYQDLCAHYRIGKQPSEKLFLRLQKAKQAIAKIEKVLEGCK